MSRACASRNYRFGIRDFEDRYNEIHYSGYFYVQNLPWRVRVEPNGDHYNVIVACESDSEYYYCLADVTVTLLSYDSDVENETKSVKHLFSETTQEWEFEDFIPSEYVLEHDSSFRDDDRIVFDVYLSAQPPILMNDAQKFHQITQSSALSMTVKNLELELTNLKSNILPRVEKLERELHILKSSTLAKTVDCLERELNDLKSKQYKGKRS